MTIRRKVALCTVLLLASNGGIVRAASSASSERDAAVASARMYSFVVDVPAPSVVPGASPFTSKVMLEGYRTRETRPGAPDFSAKTYRVAIPAGATPRLAARVLAEDVLTGTRPTAVARIEFDVDGDAADDAPRFLDELGRIRGSGIVRHERVDEDADIYQGSQVWPASVARLGEIETFRDQRYVMVTVTPARYDPRDGTVRVARKLEVQVFFDGDTGERTAPRADAQFESVYREMFVNYAEGTTFRLRADSSKVRIPGDPPAVGYTGPVYKIKIRQNRPVRLDANLTASTGFPSVPLSLWKLTSRGVEVPIQVGDLNANDMLDPEDWVQFWGQALDNEPKAPLNTDIPGTDQDIFEAGDFSDENVYFLSVGTDIGARMPPRDAAPTMTRTPPTDFEGVAKAEVDDAYRPLGGNDPWYWVPSLSSSGSSTRTDSIPLPGLASTTSPIRVISVVRGLSENTILAPDHRTRLSLLDFNSQSLAVNDDNATFDGRSIYTHDFTWPGAPGASGGMVQVRLEARPIAAGNHQVILDRIELRYRRLFQASGDVLEFSWPDEDAEFIVSQLGSNSLDVWELTQRIGSSGIVSATRLTGVSITGTGPYNSRFRVDNDPDLTDGTLRHFVIFGAGALATPAGADFVADTQSDLMLTSNQADVIVIAHPSVLGESCQSSLEQLLDWRFQNQGLTSKIALIQDVYDEFNDGLPGPDGIRRFLQWVMSSDPGEGWQFPKPSFVLLLGDSSYDYKAGTANGTYVPTQIMFKDDPSFGYYASDIYLTEVVGTDRMPDLLIGRVPARSDAECDTTIQKILGYQQSPPLGNWRRHALVISDRGKHFNVNEAGDFELTNDLALAAMKKPPHTARRIRYWTDYCGGNAAGCTCAATNLIRNDIKAAINGTDGQSDGASIMQYVGHGNFDVWSDDSIFDNNPPGARTSCEPNGQRDTDSLTNGGRLPILFVHNCLSTGMPTSAHTLGKDVFKKLGGGSVALFSPSGLTNGYFGQEASDIIWNGFFGKTKERDLAVPLMTVYADLCGVGAYEACQNYLLFGDPATRTVFPSVAPPTGVAATPGNARVDLTWTASATPGARYDVYRAVDSATNPYAKINLAPLLTTEYADTALTNTRNYFYYLVALDDDGFESRWSHFNSDCATNGPDCLRAKPLNPNPPAAPIGVVVVDAESGGKLLISWVASPEIDLKQYEVRFGTSPGVYPNLLVTGKFTSTALNSLTNGQTYYVVVTATNTSDQTSPPSVEQNGVPTLVRGLKVPQFISALRIDKAGIDTQLSWPAVTTDIYGKPTTIAYYEIYRDTTSTFVPGPGNKIGQVVSTSFPDPGALLTSSPAFYMVRAVDTQGSRGGLGNQVPNGLGALRIDPSTMTPGNVVLSWPTATTNFDGGTIVADHYEIYARPTPFSIANVRDGLIPMVGSTAAVSLDLTPAAAAQFYTVIVVDKRGNKSPF